MRSFGIGGVAIIYSETLRNSSDQPQDIVFEAEEDLFHNSPGRELLMLKGSLKVIPLTRNRLFQSYVNEFCGMVSAQSWTRGGF